VRVGRLDILLLEDDEHDIFFVRRALERCSTQHRLAAVHDGEEAIAYLRGESDFADRERFPIPNVIMTDLNMPRMNGFQFLKWLREHEECSIIPTIVYTSSNLDVDVQTAYRMGANSYIVKPSDLNRMVEILGTLAAYWTLCERPLITKSC
jgi:CheY-like chemotaxis protein